MAVCGSLRAGELRSGMAEAEPEPEAEAAVEVEGEGAEAGGDRSRRPALGGDGSIAPEAVDRKKGEAEAVVGAANG